MFAYTNRTFGYTNCTVGEPNSWDDIQHHVLFNFSDMQYYLLGSPNSCITCLAPTHPTFLLCVKISRPVEKRPGSSSLLWIYEKLLLLHNCDRVREKGPHLLEENF